MAGTLAISITAAEFKRLRAIFAELWSDPTTEAELRRRYKTEGDGWREFLRVCLFLGAGSAVRALRSRAFLRLVDDVGEPS